ncbi:hypothetical protein [Glaciecola sp. MF2-115]|uniref:hypothetical protein n=1 Tax=Glaciecola sp. MF2-115 TaxID=3384827 RepID=UPI0039A2CE6B
MADNIKTGENLDDFLINLADGLAQAQNRLNRSPVSNAMGQETMIYHIPKMEFELHLEMTATQSSEGSNKSRLKFLPSGKTTTNQSESASSIIKGTMIATPAGAGLPMPKLTISASKTTARNAKVVVKGFTSDGNPMFGASVELNVDRELSSKLNKQEGRAQELKPGTQLSLSEVILNEQGEAEANLVISAQETKGNLIAIIADFSSATETLLFRFE